jgi:hypothetical protein
MSETTFRYHPHARLAERADEGPITVRKLVRKRVAEAHGIVKFNSMFALGITTHVGTMWCAYIFALLSFVSLPLVIASGNPIAIVGWVAQTFLQLVLLPVIIVGQNIQAAASDARSNATYKDAGAILNEAKQIQEHLAAQDAATTVLLNKILALEAALQKQSGN